MTLERGLDERLEALYLSLRTCVNFIRFYTTIEYFKGRARSDDGSLVLPTEHNWNNAGDGEARADLYAVQRAELDNTAAMIEFLDRATSAPFILADNASDEDCFTLGPGLAAQLCTKHSLMIRHWLDLEALLARPNR